MMANVPLHSFLHFSGFSTPYPRRIMMEESGSFLSRWRGQSARVFQTSSPLLLGYEDHRLVTHRALSCPAAETCSLSVENLNGSTSSTRFSSFYLMRGKRHVWFSLSIPPAARPPSTLALLSRRLPSTPFSFPLEPRDVLLPLPGSDKRAIVLSGDD